MYTHKTVKFISISDRLRRGSILTIIHTQLHTKQSSPHPLVNLSNGSNVIIICTQTHDTVKSSSISEHFRIAATSQPHPCTQNSQVDNRRQTPSKGRNLVNTLMHVSTFMQNTFYGLQSQLYVQADGNKHIRTAVKILPISTNWTTNSAQ